jgi:glutamate-1-semialdehyde 2,1-aminomutase
MGQFDPRRPDALPHAGTFNNNVLTMSAGAAGLRELFTEEAATALNARGERLREALRETGRARDVPLQVTGVGSILGLHFQSEPIRRPEDTAHTPAEARALAHLELIARGQIVARRGFMSLSLALEEADYEAFVAAFDDFLAANAAVLR